MSHIPTLPDLALQYGTIDKKQFDQLTRLYNEKKAADNEESYDQMMLAQKLATGYQIGLLNLIREYLIIKKAGEVFGKIAIEKGYATREDVDAALDVQKKEFKRAKIKKLIGDILVEKGVITLKQKNDVLHSQEFVDTQASQILLKEDQAQPEAEQSGKDLDLTSYEKQFLKIKALDDEFAAALIEKEMVTDREIKIAQKAQEDAFKKQSRLRILGDIMVEMKFLTDDQKKQILKIQKRNESSKTKEVQKDIEITISRDNMEAWAVIGEDSENITLESVKKAIQARGITHGIYSDALIQCCLDSKSTRFLCAGQDFGSELVKQKIITYHFDTNTMEKEEVRKGESLAQLNAVKETLIEKDLFGNTYERPNPAIFRCGKGVRLSKDKTKVFAGKTGFPSMSIEGKLFIHPPISVLEDADLRYGPLEPYANLTVSGVLTGAYPVTSGHIKAREIRGARIQAIGDVNSQVGITDSVIVAQGDIRARYLHNCRIETFGDVYIENEMIDSQIYCGGKIDSGNCHVISSTLYAKKGIEISGAGSGKTNPCTLGAGTEHQTLERVTQLEQEISNIRKELDELIEKKDEHHFYSKKTFQRMVELKIFHDRAKKKKEKLTADFKLKKDSYSKEKLNNIARLIHNYEKRKNSSVTSLKELNEIKKKYDKQAAIQNEKIEKLKPRIKRETLEYKNDISFFIEWSRRQTKSSQIRINKSVFPGTIFKGIFSSLIIEEEKSNFIVFEKQISDTVFEMSVRKN